MNGQELEASIREFAGMISRWDWLLIFLVWLGLHTVEERFPEPFVRHRIGWRLMPFIPPVICIACCFVPGPWIAGDVTWPMRVLFGGLLGVIAYNFGGIANRLGLGKFFNAIGINVIVEKTGGKSHSKTKDNAPP